MDPSGGSVVHSFGRLIPHEFPITDLQQISGANGMGMITCTVSSGTVMFTNPGDGVTLATGQSMAALTVNDINADTFRNRDVECINQVRNIYFYLFLSPSNNRESIYVHSMYHNRCGAATVNHTTLYTCNLLN